MIRINKNNYEEYALDYIEGNLAGAQKREFERFLGTDEAIRDEVSFLMSGMPLLTPEGNLYPGKKSLLRKTPLRRAMPYLGGAVAASVLLCLFVLISPSNNTEREQSGNLAVFVPNKGTHTDIKEVSNKPDFTKLPVKTDKHTKLPASNSPAKNNEEKESEPRTSGVVAPVIQEKETDIPDDKREYYDAPVMAENVITNDMMDGLESGINERKEITIPARLVSSQGGELLAEANFGAEVQTPGTSFRRGLSVLLMPVEQAIPVNRFQAGDSKGIEIASLIRITKKTRK